MLEIIDLSSENDFRFGFLEPVSNRLLEVNIKQCWTTFEEFESDVRIDNKPNFPFTWLKKQYDFKFANKRKQHKLSVKQILDKTLIDEQLTDKEKVLFLRLYMKCLTAQQKQGMTHDSISTSITRTQTLEGLERKNYIYVVDGRKVVYWSREVNNAKSLKRNSIKVKYYHFD